MADGGRRPLRVAIVADLLEERWPSMDLVADMLVSHLQTPAYDGQLRVELQRPTLRRVSARFPRSAQVADRFINRFWDYPRWLARRSGAFDVFHVVDHSYAHVVSSLPAGKSVVTCHDVDAFLSLVRPDLSTTTLPRVLSRRVLAGLYNAAAVTCVTRATYDELRQYDLVPADRLAVVPNGVHPSLSAAPSPEADAEIARIAGVGSMIDLLHVGSCIPRKRIDLLLRVFAAVRQVEPRARLLKAGGRFTDAQRDLIRELCIGDRIVEFPFLQPDRLAALYRRAHAVLVPSEREGFGLPVIEAMACGTCVVATDLPVFHEVGGDAIYCCGLDDVAGWRDRVVQLVAARENALEATRLRQRCLEQAARFSWTGYAETMAGIYRTVGRLDAKAAVAAERRLAENHGR